MLELGGKLHFPQEALARDRERQLGLKHLHGDVAVVLQVASPVDRRHPAATHFPLDRVAVAQGSLETAQRVAHWARVYPYARPNSAVCGGAPPD